MNDDAELSSVWNFLGSWFPDADLEGLNDAQVVKEFLETKNETEIDKVRRQLAVLLSLDNLPVFRVSKEANRHFESAEECRQWLVEIAAGLRAGA